MELTDFTKAHVKRLFAPEQRAEVERLLSEQCGENLPLMGGKSPNDFERIHCAALKLSDGNMARLYAAVKVAKNDWRALLVRAGFGGTDVHQRW